MKNDDGALSFGTAIDMSGFDAGHRADRGESRWIDLQC